MMMKMTMIDSRGVYDDKVAWWCSVGKKGWAQIQEPGLVNYTMIVVSSS